MGTNERGVVMAEERAETGQQDPLNLHRIFVNHVGFTPSAGKRVVVLDPPEPKFAIHRQFGGEVFTGALIKVDYVPNEFYPPTPQIPGAVMIGIEGDEKDQPVRYRSHYPSVGCSEYDMPVTAEFLWLLAEITAEGADGK
jgi:hypothetical protein